MARAWASHAPAYHLSTSVLQGGKLRACQRTATETQRGRVRTQQLRGHPTHIETIQQRCIPNIQCGSATGSLCDYSTVGVGAAALPLPAPPTRDCCFHMVRYLPAGALSLMRKSWVPCSMMLPRSMTTMLSDL